MKALLLIRQDLDAQAAAEEMKALEDRSTERLAFLKKQVDDLQKEVQDEREKLWKGLEAKLKERGVLPKDFDKKKTGLRMDYEAGVLYTYDLKKESQSPLDALMSFFKHIE